MPSNTSHASNNLIQHSTTTRAAPAEAEYDRLRHLARQEHAKKQSCLDRAYQAYEEGDGATAHQLSEEGKRHAALRDRYNKQASEYIFRENNAVGWVDGDTIDLHGQYVEEAEEILEKRIRYARSTGQTHLHVIVGRGNHSYDHVQKLKPKVEQICRELGLQYATEENEGRIYINLTGGPAPQHLFGEGYPGGHQQHQTAQHGQGSYPGQQQHYHGGQQQHHDGGEDHQTQNNEVVNFVKRLLPRLFRSCCIVM